ncbi:hypothetical protein GCM10025782_29410 [Pedococcus ginsenosidimutans]|uniref:DUF4386 family protein n=1 Tax=Pedococcus ginsenosidimutans TaxID=490570 RepID=A0ABP8YFE8_9MICO
MSQARTAALAGALYVALDIVVGVTAGAPPPPAAPEGEIVTYLADHRAGLAAGLWLFGLATLPLLWWFGSLWDLMIRAEEGAPRLAVVSLAGLLLGGTMSLGSAAAMATLALLPPNTGGALALYAFAAMSLSAAGFGLAAHLIATNVLAARSRMLPRWLVATGLVSAAAFLISAVLGALTADAISNTVSLVGFVLWLAWILDVSYRMYNPAQHAQQISESPAASGTLSSERRR